jgi:hypothetical protein
VPLSVHPVCAEQAAGEQPDDDSLRDPVLTEAGALDGRQRVNAEEAGPSWMRQVDGLYGEAQIPDQTGDHAGPCPSPEEPAEEDSGGDCDQQRHGELRLYTL